jgi:DNA-binding transcriptional ArsR family regulator
MVGNIVDQLPVSQSTVSQHLQILKQAGWIKGKIEGPRVCYCLKKGIFEQYTEMLNELKEI